MTWRYGTAYWAIGTGRCWKARMGADCTDSGRIVIEKRRSSGFFGTNLVDRLIYRRVGTCRLRV